jgi:sugar phosphate isomerase/epimerase
MSADLVSLQLYTVRRELDRDTAGTLEAIAGFGYRQVELYDFVDRLDAYRAGLEANALVAPTAHARLVGRDLDEIFAAAASLGVGTVFDPFIDESRWTSEAGVASVAADLNDIAARASAHGLAIGYHNHAFEFSNRFGGVSAFELLAQQLDAAVRLQVDTYWAAVGGEPDIPALLTRLGGAVTALHIKDGPLTHDDDDQVALGDGSMDFAPIIAAAPDALRVVELDGFRGDVLEAVRASHDYLRGEVVAR